MLQRRLDLLEQVATLATQLGVLDDAGYTCETAGYFYLLHVLGRWERFCAAVAAAPVNDTSAVKRLFPFTDFFAEAPPPLFKEVSVEGDMEAARVCWRHLQTMFTELEVRCALKVAASSGSQLHKVDSCIAGRQCPVHLIPVNQNKQVCPL
jgi:intron-binding protein aquarius